ncbi:hypothetical protein RUM43_002815 [Polyplax serrata]|uniref:Uncharacterized protein n=1 Tax=Polyplax serrata TaxID=468196 RepID=A0AAN8Q009_POLSC
MSFINSESVVNGETQIEEEEEEEDDLSELPLESLESSAERGNRGEYSETSGRNRDMKSGGTSPSLEFVYRLEWWLKCARTPTFKPKELQVS